MINDDKQIGTPLVDYRDTQANIEALTGMLEGATAYATDIDMKGMYDGSRWLWYGRERLTADRTYYVRIDGSDSNNGLANTAGGAFLTLQKAVDIVSGLDTNGHIATIQVASGTYSGVTLKNAVGYSGAGDLVIQGDTSVPTNCWIQMSGTRCFYGDGLNVVWDIKGFKVTNSAGQAFYIANGGGVRLSNINFGLCSSIHMQASQQSTITLMTDYTISAGASYHLEAEYGGMISILNRTATFAGNSAFTSAFAYAANVAFINCVNAVFATGTYSITGKRYNVIGNAVIWVNGASIKFLPGNSDGTTSAGGQYY